MHLLPPALLALISTVLATDESQCRTSSLPNPIASQYHGNITGVINGTLAVLPIPYSMARRIIPAQYQILKDQYRAILPSLPKDMYPALLQNVFDSDIRYMDYRMPDFSRASIEFPFVRYYDDEDTPFRFANHMLMTGTNEMGIKGASEYGTAVYPAEFEPECDAYLNAGSDRTKFNTRAKDTYLDSTWQQQQSQGMPASSLMQYLMHATNQPMFGLNGHCNHQTRMFNTELSMGRHEPRPVKGAVRAKIPSVFDTEMIWTEAAGVQVATAFIEKHMIPCEEVRNWTYDENETQDAVHGNLEL